MKKTALLISLILILTIITGCIKIGGCNYPKFYTKFTAEEHLELLNYYKYGDICNFCGYNKYLGY